jgi:hypothetical protein
MQRSPPSASASAKCVISVTVPSCRGHRRQFAPHGRQLRGGQAEAIHAAVELEVDRQATRQRGLAQHLQLLEAMQSPRQVVLGTDSQIGGLEKAFEQQNRLANAGLAQRDRLVEIEQGETVGDLARAAAARSRPCP